MAQVTVQSSISGDVVKFPFGSIDNLQLAHQIAAAISSGVANGQLDPARAANGPPPTLPRGDDGVFFQDRNGLTVLSKEYKAVVDTAAQATIVGGGAPGESVLSGNGNLTFIATGGSGTVVAGGGNDKVVVPLSDHGSWLIATGGGNDTIVAAGGGNNTIRAGAGHNTVVLGHGKDLVQLTGNDTVIASSGHDTITATHAKSTLVVGESAHVQFVGGPGAATVLGGSGSDTVYGGSGHLVAHGGSAGDNLLVAGAGSATLFGSQTEDSGSAGDDPARKLFASLTNETLSATLNKGHHALADRDDHPVSGQGADTFVGGSGQATMVGGSGKETFEFMKGQSGGTDLIQNFNSSDKIILSGYGANAVTDALATQARAHGSVTITLSDNTKITFSDLSSLKTSNFG